MADDLWERRTYVYRWHAEEGKRDDPIQLALDLMGADDPRYAAAQESPCSTVSRPLDQADPHGTPIVKDGAGPPAR